MPPGGFRGDSEKRPDRLQVVFEAFVGVAAALFEDGAGALVFLEGEAVVEEFVVFLEHQQVVGPVFDGVGVDGAEGLDVARRPFEVAEVVEVFDEACPGFQRLPGFGGGVDEDRFEAVFFGQVGGVEASERGADEVDFSVCEAAFNDLLQGVDGQFGDVGQRGATASAPKRSRTSRALTPRPLPANPWM